MSLKTTDEYLKEKGGEICRRRSPGRIFGRWDRDWKAVEYSGNILRRKEGNGAQTGWLGIFWGLRDLLQVIMIKYYFLKLVIILLWL